MTRKTKIAAVGGALVLAGAITAFALHNAGAAPAKQNAGIETVAVQQHSLNVTAEASGTVQPPLIVEVKSRASGQLLKLHVQTGDVVKQGQVIAEIDPRDVRNALDQARADLEVAKVQVQTATEQAKRTDELRKAQVITAQEYETSVLSATNARAQLVKAQTNFELAQQKAGDVTIEAPFNGTIIEKDVEAGQIIASASQNVSGGTTLFKMADLSTMQVRALVDETDIGKVQVGQTARVTVEAYQGRAFMGTVEKIEPQAVTEQNVTMFPVLITLDNGEGLLKTGMNADVEIQIARRNDALVVPNDAVVSMTDVSSIATALGLDPEQVRSSMRGNRPAAAGGAAQTAKGAATAAGGASRAGAAPGEGRTRGAGAAGATAGGGARGFGRGAWSRNTGGGNTRPAFVFVSTTKGYEARRVMLGVNDFDNTEVVSGVKDGEQVVIAFALRLKQQQQQTENQMRQRAGSMMGTGGAGRAAGGARGGR